MLLHLTQKELRHHLLDSRFIVVFIVCALLAGLSVYVGTQNYLIQQRDYSAVSESGRKTLQGWLEQGSLFEFSWMGYTWNRPPEILSPIVHGLSGTLGQVASIQYERVPQFEATLFETDPVHALFGIMDLAFIVKFVMTLAVILFTYDAVCGEKENGTLRLYASFPVARSTIALAKLIGSTLAVLVPFVFAFLLASVVMALSPSLGLRASDWARMLVLMVVFGLSLSVFAAFGLFISSLTQRRLTAFLGLLALWTIWLFVIPNLALRAARSIAPVESIFAQQKKGGDLFWEARNGRRAELNEYWRPVQDWDSLSPQRQQELQEGEVKISRKWDTHFLKRLKSLQISRRNQMRSQQDLVVLLSSLSPISPLSFMTMDLARTGLHQLENHETRLAVHHNYLIEFIRTKQSESGDRTITDFVPFKYKDTETLDACLARNLLPILNLALLAILGFAGAYFAILRYDVR
jgi:ABC-type transport system involved in multi-copper enzyme maturation permease subunit